VSQTEMLSFLFENWYQIMNILKYELKSNLKVFFFWTLGLFFLMFAGMTKFTGISADNGTNMSELFDQFPRVVLAVFGMVGLDITTIGGYYSILVYYVLICIAVYGMSLGINAVNRESIDKTHEFLYTKPRTRRSILEMKLLAACIYLIAFTALSYLFSISAISTLKFENTINKPIILFTITVLITGLLFCAIGTFIATVTKKIEKGALYGNLFFLASFLFSVIYDMFENGGLLKFLAPFKYFNPNDLLEGNLDIVFVLLCIVCTILLAISSFILFEKKDLNAV
jgi:ABC-2 type transport system permease protein